MQRLFFLGMMIAVTGIVSAKTSTPSVVFDFKNLKIFSPGVYVPSADETQKVDNMKAETLARANGIETLSKYFEQSCAGLNGSEFRLNPGFAQKFRSQGTEMYADGALKVNLMASYAAVFQYRVGQTLKTENGETLVFLMPSSMPATSLTCGTPTLEFNNSDDQLVHVQIVPNRSQAQVSGTEKVIKLTFDAKKNALVVTNVQDAALLRNTDIPMSDNGATFLPVAVIAEH